jgi:hypothetical protein
MFSILKLRGPPSKRVARMAERVTCIVRGDLYMYSDCRVHQQIRTEARAYSRLEAHDKVKNEPVNLRRSGRFARQSS